MSLRTFKLRFACTVFVSDTGEIKVVAGKVCCTCKHTRRIVYEFADGTTQEFCLDCKAGTAKFQKNIGKQLRGLRKLRRYQKKNRSRSMMFDGRMQGPLADGIPLAHELPLPDLSEIVVGKRWAN